MKTITLTNVETRRLLRAIEGELTNVTRLRDSWSVIFEKRRDPVSSHQMSIMNKRLAELKTIRSKLE